METDDLTLAEAARYLSGPALARFFQLCSKIRRERGKRRRDILSRLQAKIDAEGKGA